MTTYECAICLNVNHASKLHCSTCGTVPAKYSVLSVPTRMLSHEDHGFIGDWLIPVVVARGADRAEHHHTTRVYLRTVKADYYASPAD